VKREPNELFSSQDLAIRPTRTEYLGAEVSEDAASRVKSVDVPELEPTAGWE
jgi:hypothetical protein